MGASDGSGRDNNRPLSPGETSRKLLDLEQRVFRSVIDALIRFCLEQKLVVALVLAFGIIWGMMVAPFDWNLGGLPRDPVPVDAIPDISENQQIVFTKWPGHSPQDVQDQITFPLTSALLGISDVKVVRGSSMFGFSSVYVIFEEGVDLDTARNRLLTKLSSLPRPMPAGVRPALGPEATATGQIFWYTLEGRDKNGNITPGVWSLHEKRSVQDWYLRFDLLAAKDDDNRKPIAEVAAVGGHVKEYQINVDPAAMREHNVTLDQVFRAVKRSNTDVGARTLEVNSVEYVIRGLGFIESVEDIEKSVVKVVDNVPLYIRNVAKVSFGPALRRGALDKEGAEAVGGVVVVRYGENPLAAIKAVKNKLDELGERGTGPGGPYWLLADRTKTLPDGRTSHLAVVPFYDRTELIYETLDTLNDALVLEILVTVIVVLVMVRHFRSSLLISASLPVAILMCFIAMKQFNVDANIVALSGIAIAIGTIVDMGIIICENILKHLEAADPDDNRLEVVYRAATEVGGAVLTAVATTIVGFLPVFFMTGDAGKLFRPLAFTKTFALIASVVVALTIIPAGAHLLMGARAGSRRRKILILCALIAAGLALAFAVAWWAGLIVIALAVGHFSSNYVPDNIRKLSGRVVLAAAVALAGILLAKYWMPLGLEHSVTVNFLFIALIIGGLLGLFHLFLLVYPRMLRWCLTHKLIFLTLPMLLLLFGAYVWLGPGIVLGPIERASLNSFADQADIKALVERGLLEESDVRPLVWTSQALALGKKDDKATAKFKAALEELAIKNADRVFDDWSETRELIKLGSRKWGGRDDPDPKAIRYQPLKTRMKWHMVRDWNGRGREFMPPLDEGSFLFMPSTMPHASFGTCLKMIKTLDIAIKAVPEVDVVVGKIGRADTPLDPAPISMVETVVTYKPEYKTGTDGRRLRFAFDREGQSRFLDENGKPLPAQDGEPYDVRGRFERDAQGRLVPDEDGVPFRQWRPALDPQLNPDREPWPGIKNPDDIWNEITKAAKMPGVTGAPKLQPILTRIIMLQSGMRAAMGIKVFGPDQKSIDAAAFQIERLLKSGGVPAVEPDTVTAERLVAQEYLEIKPDREACSRYGLNVQDVQDAIDIAIGGRTITWTVEGRETYPVRVRYPRERRSEIEDLGRILVPAPGGAQIPLVQLTNLRDLDSVVRPGPMSVKSEDTYLLGYVTFDMKPGNAEVDVVEACQRFLEQKRQTGELVLPKGVKYSFAGTYESQVRAQKTLWIVLPLALFVIFMILYLQFRSVPTTFVVFSGIAVAWAGGFLLLWLYAQPWFLDFAIFGVEMRDLFGMHTINMSVAVWVGFLALFGIASDDGVVMTTYLNQSFGRLAPDTIDGVREATIAAASRRIRACLMTSATTILALIPVLTSTGRGSDVMIPMAIPSFGGMLVVLISEFVTPVLYCWLQERKLSAAPRRCDEAGARS